MKKQHNPPPPMGAKPPPPPAPPAVGARPSSAAHSARALERVYELARQIADEAAMFRVQQGRVAVDENGVTWWRRMYNLGPDWEERALEYLALRGLIEYSADGKLVRFVEEGK